MGIKAIETVWDGHRFRSRLEARWAVFFDDLGIEYEYEPEGYELPSGRWYLPDFYLPKRDLYIEVKGSMASDPEGVSRAREFENNIATWLIFVTAKDLEVNPQLRIALRTATEPGDYIPERGALLMQFLDLDWWNGTDLNRFEHAQLAATRARFDHGDAPISRREALSKLGRPVELWPEE